MPMLKYRYFSPESILLRYGTVVNYKVHILFLSKFYLYICEVHLLLEKNIFICWMFNESSPGSLPGSSLYFEGKFQLVVFAPYSFGVHYVLFLKFSWCCLSVCQKFWVIVHLLSQSFFDYAGNLTIYIGKFTAVNYLFWVVHNIFTRSTLVYLGQFIWSAQAVHSVNNLTGNLLLWSWSGVWSKKLMYALSKNFSPVVSMWCIFLRIPLPLIIPSCRL